MYKLLRLSTQCYTVMFISSFSHVRLSLDNKRLLTYLLSNDDDDDGGDNNNNNNNTILSVPSKALFCNIQFYAPIRR